MPSRWIVVSKGNVFLAWPPFVLLLAILAAASVVAFIMLRELTESRKHEIRSLIRNNLIHALIGAILFFAYLGLRELSNVRGINEITELAGIITLVQWGYFSIKLGRLVVFVSLFLSNLHVQFPVLVANIATLIIAIAVVSTVATEVFSVQVMPLFATSAVATLVFGIALQDTLGNLFAGIALQMDNPFQIGHWIEVTNGSQVTIGKVMEISWRATVLQSFTDELITIPNRVLSGSAISNYSISGKAFSRGKTIRLSFGVDIEKARKTMFDAIQNTAGVITDPPSIVAISEITESWISFRIVYNLLDYSRMLTIGDAVQCNVINALKREGIDLATQRLLVATET